MSSLSVGQVAGTLGVAPSTVRMWGRRYGLTASDRSAGGHRRYTAEDVDRLRRMHDAVISGVSPAAAAARVVEPSHPARSVTRSGSVDAIESHRPAAGGAATDRGPLEGGGTDADGVRSGDPGSGSDATGTRTRRQVGSRPAGTPGRGGPGGAVLAVPRAGREARGLARAASRLDEVGAADLVLGALRERGTLAVWDEVLRPVLVAAGLHWERTGAGIEIEHLLTQAVTTALYRHVAALPELARDGAVILAGGPREEHVLAMHAVRAALAERGVPARFLGPRTPMAVIAAAARRTRTPAVLVWLTLTDPSATAGLAAVRAAHRRLELFVGGPGWSGQPLDPAIACRSLGDAVTLLAQSWDDRPGVDRALLPAP